MAGLDFKHLDLMDEKGIKEGKLPKNIQTKISKFKIEKAKFDEDQDDENAEAAASRLSDEIADLIETFMKSDEYKATLAPAKKEKAVVDESQIEAVIEKREAKKAQDKLDAEYASAIKNADSHFAGKDFDTAINGYQIAAGLKPNETYPSQQIELAKQAAETARLEAEKAAAEMGAKERDEKYATVIAQADEAFTAKKYAEAKALYAEAQILKPEETYPTAQIDACDKAISDDEAAVAAAKQKTEAEAKRKAESNPLFDALDI